MKTQGRHCSGKGPIRSPADAQCPSAHRLAHLPCFRWRPHRCPPVQASTPSITSESSPTHPHPEVLEIPPCNYFLIHPPSLVQRPCPQRRPHYPSCGLRFQLAEPVCPPSHTCQKHSTWPPEFSQVIPILLPFLQPTAPPCPPLTFYIKSNLFRHCINQSWRWPWATFPVSTFSPAPILHSSHTNHWEFPEHSMPFCTSTPFHMQFLL